MRQEVPAAKTDLGVRHQAHVEQRHDEGVPHPSAEHEQGVLQPVAQSQAGHLWHKV